MKQQHLLLDLRLQWDAIDLLFFLPRHYVFQIWYQCNRVKYRKLLFHESRYVFVFKRRVFKNNSKVFYKMLIIIWLYQSSFRQRRTQTPLVASVGSFQIEYITLSYRFVSQATDIIFSSSIAVFNPTLTFLQDLSVILFSLFEQASRSCCKFCFIATLAPPQRISKFKLCIFPSR